MSTTTADHTPIRHAQLTVHQDRSHPSPPTRQALISTSQTQPTSLPASQVAILSSPPSTPIQSVTTIATTSQSAKAFQPSGIFDLDDPCLPLHAAQRPTEELARELVCRFRAIHTPSHLFRSMDWGIFGEVVVNTPSHLHINVKFEYLHMMNAIKQAWINTHIKPDTECVLRLGEPVLNEARELHVQEKPQDLPEALFPKEETPEALGEGCSSLRRGKSSSDDPAREISVVQSADCDPPMGLSEDESTVEKVHTPGVMSVGTQTDDFADISDVRVRRSGPRKARETRSIASQHSPGSTAAGHQLAKLKSGIPQKKSWAQIVSRHQ